MSQIRTILQDNKLDKIMFDEAEQAIKDYIAKEMADEYRRGYNDNARDCYCNSPGATEGVLAHHHLMDDGKSHNIRPEFQRQRLEKA